jgi:hypothetical protein
VRALAIPLALAVTASLVYCAALLARHVRDRARARDRTRARWHVAVTMVDDRDVVVTVRLTGRADAVLAEHVVARIAGDDAGWQRRFLAARQEAEERAFHLNADRPTPGRDRRRDRP